MLWVYGSFCERGLRAAHSENSCCRHSHYLWWMNDTRLSGPLTVWKHTVQCSSCGKYGVTRKGKSPFFFKSRVIHLLSSFRCWAPWTDNWNISQIHSLAGSKHIAAVPQEPGRLSFNIWYFLNAATYLGTSSVASMALPSCITLRPFPCFCWLLHCFYILPLLTGIK